MVLVGNLQLVLERGAPKVVFRQMCHRVHEAVLQEPLGNVETLELVHCFNLLLSLHAGYFQRFVFVLDPRDFSFDFFLPV